MTTRIISEAQQAYQTQEMVIGGKIQELTDLLTMHSETAKDCDRDWSFTGDLMRISSLIQEAIDFINPENEGE